MFEFIATLFSTLEKQTFENDLQARKSLLESVQSLERQKQHYQFQLEQLNLHLEQTKAAHAMEQEFQRVLKVQDVEVLPVTKNIKMVLRKR